MCSRTIIISMNSRNEDYKENAMLTEHIGFCLLSSIIRSIVLLGIPVKTVHD